MSQTGQASSTGSPSQSTGYAYSRTFRPWTVCNGVRQNLSNRIQNARSAYSTQLQTLAKIARKKGSFFHLTCLGILTTIIIGGWSLRYAADQQKIAWETLKLAEWTAKKDFREVCQDQAASQADLNPKCDLILKGPFPEPPYVDHRPWKRTAWTHSILLMKPLANPVELYPSPELEHTGDPDVSEVQSMVHLIELIACVSIVICFRRKLLRLRPCLLSGRFASAAQHREASTGIIPLDSIGIDTGTYQSTGAEIVPNSGLRRRGGRKPPTQSQNIWQAAKVGNVEEIHRHLDEKVEIDAFNVRSDCFGTPLSVAARHGRKDVVDLLLRHGARPDGKKSWYSETALQAAAAKGHVPIVRLLLDHGADINSRVCGFTAFSSAAQNGCKEVAELLIAEGSDIRLSVTSYTETTLQVLAPRLSFSTQRNRLVWTLLESGAAILCAPTAPLADGFYPVVDKVDSLLDQFNQLYPKEDRGPVEKLLSGAATIARADTGQQFFDRPSGQAFNAFISHISEVVEVSALMKSFVIQLGDICELWGNEDSVFKERVDKTVISSSWLAHACTEIMHQAFRECIRSHPQAYQAKEVDTFTIHLGQYVEDVATWANSTIRGFIYAYDVSNLMLGSQSLKLQAEQRDPDEFFVQNGRFIT